MLVAAFRQPAARWSITQRRSVLGKVIGCGGAPANPAVLASAQGRFPCAKILIALLLLRAARPPLRQSALSHPAHRHGGRRWRLRLHHGRQRRAAALSGAQRPGRSAPAGLRPGQPEADRPDRRRQRPWHGGGPATGHGFASSKPITMFDAAALHAAQDHHRGRQSRWHGVRCSADKQLYVLSHTAPNITAIDAARWRGDWARSTWAPRPRKASDGAGHLYVALENNNAVGVVDTKTMTVMTLSPGDKAARPRAWRWTPNHASVRGLPQSGLAGDD